MQHARPRRAGATVPPDDAALAQLFQRVRYQDTDALTQAFCVLAQSLGSQDTSTTRLRRSTVAVTTKHALAHEVRETELVVHQNIINNRLMSKERESFNLEEQEQEVGSTCKIPVLQDLEELMNELYEVYDRGASGSDGEEPEEELSIQEREYANALQQAVVMTLTHATLAKYSSTSSNNKTDQQDQLPLGEVRVWLLEMVVRPSALSRQLAFTLLLNLSVNVTVIVLTTAPVEAVKRQAEQMQTRLFHVLVEMLSKAVVVASSSVKEPKRKSSTTTNSSRDHQWIAQAVGCLLLFAKHNCGGSGGRYRADRLWAFDPQILRFFLKEARQTKPNGKTGGDLENHILELLVVTMYAQEADVVRFSDPSNKAQVHESPVRIALPPTALEHFGGLDSLLFHYYNTHSLYMRRLLFMVFFDVTCHQQRLKTSSSCSHDKDDEELWRLFQDWDLAVHLASTPGLFTASSSSRTVKKLCASTLSPEVMHQLPEKLVQHFVNQLRLLIHVDEYFVQSSSLSNTLQLLHDQEKHNVTDALMAKVTQLLGSSCVEDKFQAERWLAELVTYGMSGGSGSALESSAATPRGNSSIAQEEDDPLGESVIFTDSEHDLESSSSYLAPAAAHNQSSDAADDLEETCCFDEDASIRIAARNKFWELAKSPSVGHRESFARTLGVFVKRKLGAKNPSDLVSIAREINMCLRVVIQQRETNQRVLVHLMLLVLEVCKCEVSYRDHQKQQYDQQCAVLTGENESFVRLGSDSIASRVVEGGIALDAALIKEFLPQFFIHVLSVLQLQSHPRQHCRQRCCGTAVSSPLVGDLMTSIALILTNDMLNGSNAPSMAKTGGSDMQALLPFMEACDTRVAVMMAKLVVSSLKRSDSDQYAEILSELHANAVESDDEALLTLSFLHASALLAKWVH